MQGAQSDMSGRYEVLGLVKQGSFGTAVAAMDVEAGMNVAITRVHHVATCCSGARRVLREVAIMRALRHYPNIINLANLWVDANSRAIYIVSELMECDLERILASGYRLTAAHVQVLLKQLLLGTQAMHRHGILHRDLKPANILLLSDCQLRITEFGHACRLKIPPPEGIATLKGNAADDEVCSAEWVGEIWYQAPEAVLGSQGSFGEAVDVWSIGCILGEMLGSRGPLFPGKGKADQICQTLTAMGKPESEWNDALGHEVEEGVMALTGRLEAPSSGQEGPPSDVKSGRLLESLIPPEVDKEAFQLLRMLLEVNVRRRLTVSQALDHSFFDNCPELMPAAASADTGTTANASMDKIEEDVVAFRFENDDLTSEDLWKEILAEAASYTDTKQEPNLRRGKFQSGTPPTRGPPHEAIPSLKEAISTVRARARCQDRQAAVAEGEKDDVNAYVGGRLGPDSLPQLVQPSEEQCSYMSNLAEARDGDDFNVHGSPVCDTGSSIRDLTSTPLEGVDIPSDELIKSRLRQTAAIAANGARGDKKLREASGERVQYHAPEIIAVDTPDCVGRHGDNVDYVAVAKAADDGKKLYTKQEGKSSSGERLPQPTSMVKRSALEDSQESFRRSTVISMKDVAATRIQATCRRRAVQKAFRNKHRSAAEGRVKSPVRATRRAAPEVLRAPTEHSKQRQKQQNVSERVTVGERQRASSVVQQTHRRAAAIRRARTEHDYFFQTQQFSFGPGFQKPNARTARDRDSWTDSSSRGRSLPPLNPGEEDERQKKSYSRAAIKIQSQARRKAASRRVAAARQRRIAAMMVGALDSVPRLPVGSSSLLSSAVGRTAAKVQREPLAILRHLRGDGEIQREPKTDQLMMQMTIKSAIEAHIKKTGAARRKPRPLPTVPSWRQGMKAMKLKSSQQQHLRHHHQMAMAPSPLAKAHVISPLHRVVRQVDRFMAGRGRQRLRGRPRSAPPIRATDRLHCAIFTTERVVEGEHDLEE